MRRDEAGQTAGTRRLFQPRRPRGEGQTAGRVPQVMQMESVECGAACLAMVCAYWGKWVPLDELRRMCGVGRDGAKAGNIARAAQRLGMEVHAYRFEPERLREKATFPCIVHWNAYHFVVVRGFKRGRVLINDPARGAYACSWEEFDRSFTGVCICMQPGEAFEPGGARPSVRHFILENLRDAKGALAFVAFTTLLSAFVGLMNPAFSQVFVTRLLVERNENWLAPFMAVLVGVCAIQVATAVLSAVYLLKVQGKLDVSAASRFMWKALHLPVDFFSQRSVGDVSGRMSTTTRVSKELVSLVAPLIINMGMLVVYLVILVCYSPMLASVGLVATLVNVACAIVVARQRTEISRVQARDWANLSAASLAGIQTIETIKASGAENGFFRQWAVYQAQANTQTVRSQNLSVGLGVVPQVASAVSNALVLALGLLLVMQGEFTAGMVLAFQGYLAQFAAPAQQLVESLQALSEMRVDIERIEDVLTAQDDPAFTAQDAPVPGPTFSPRGRLEMRGVSFGYNTQKPLLSRGSTSRRSRGGRWRSWAAAVAASRRLRAWQTAWCSLGRARSCSMVRTSVACLGIRLRMSCPWCVRSPRFLPTPWPTTSPCGTPRSATHRLCEQLAMRHCTTRFFLCRKATAICSPRAGQTSRAVSVSALRSHVRLRVTRASSSSTRRQAPSMPRRRSA